jgi:hypothetical protein
MQANRKHAARVLLALAIAALAATLSACEHEGPAEKAGKKIDHAAEKSADAVKDAGDKVKDAAK